MAYVAPRADTEHSTQLEAGNEVGVHLLEPKTSPGNSREWPLPAGDFYDNRYISTTSSTSTTTSTSSTTTSTTVTSSTSSTTTSTTVTSSTSSTSSSSTTTTGP